jgi:5-(carboxyamino)imidazole ribonucleotide synthase
MPDLAPILPPATLGVLGGGQLGRMFAIEARRCGYRVAIYTDEPKGSPAGQVADLEFNGAYDNEALLHAFLDEVSVVTVEFENIPENCLRIAEARRPLRPGLRAIHTTQHRQREKEFLRANGIECAPFCIVSDELGLRQAVAELGRPCVVKTAAFGYDGKGQSKVEQGSDLGQVWSGFEGRSAVVEQWVPFVCEISVVGARAVDGSLAVHGVIENQHLHHILDLSLVPARVGAEVAQQALALWRAVAEALDYVGTLAVEMFVTAGGRVLVNEVAPRPHNSGHFSIDACLASQFGLQLRAICGLALADASPHSASVMINLLGDVWPDGNEPDWAAVLNQPWARLHLYGKAHPRARRKMGHITVLGEDLPQALERAQAIKRSLGMP